jgi:beta-glucosidase
MSVDAIISERALREVYLRPFEIAVKEAQPFAVMTAYNSLNGDHCDSSTYLLSKILRGDWNWDGLVMSDWGGTNSTVGSLEAGLDLEMPGPTLHRKLPDVLGAIRRGQVTESTIDARARAVLKFLERVHAFETPDTGVECTINRPEHQRLIRDAASQAIVLLKNEGGILPLTKDKVQGKKVALLGLAKTALVHGGGSAAVNAHYKVTPWEAFQTVWGDVADLIYAEGAHTQRFMSPISIDGQLGTLVGLDGKPGWTRLAYEQETLSLTSTRHGERTSTLAPFNFETFQKVVEFSGQFSPRETGGYCFGISGVGPTDLYINDEKVFGQAASTPDAMGFLFGVQEDQECVYHFTAGVTYSIRVRSVPSAHIPELDILEGRPGMRLGLMLASERDADLLIEAVKAAKEANYAIVFTGHAPQWETEGQDQQSFDLPKNGSQNALVAAVAAVNPNTIVVNSTGVAVAMPWLENVSAVVQAWFSGQEAGNSIVDVLVGKINPEGRLPVTFPKSLEDTPAFGNFPGILSGHPPVVEYKEGVFVGYRHFDRISRDKINFPFGHGLSYSSFDYGDLKVERGSDDLFSVSLNTQNTGELYGGALVQIYAGFSETDSSHPLKTLVAFEKVRLEPGHARVVTLLVPLRHLAYFDETLAKWLVRAGDYEVSTGYSVADIVQRATLRIAQEVTYNP